MVTCPTHSKNMRPLLSSSCPTDALYVSPLSEAIEGSTERDLIERGIMRKFQTRHGWKNSKPRGTGGDMSYRIFENGTIIP